MESSEGLGTSGEPSGCSTERERRRGRDRGGHGRDQGAQAPSGSCSSGTVHVSESFPASLAPSLTPCLSAVCFWHVEGRAEVDKGWTCVYDVSRGTLALTAAGVRRARRVCIRRQREAIPARHVRRAQARPRAAPPARATRASQGPTAEGVRRASRVSVGLTPCQPLYGGFLSCLTCVGSRGRFPWISL